MKLEKENKQLVLLDQSRLPNEIRYLYLEDAEEIREAIAQLKVRGAPAIGVAAACGLYAAAAHFPEAGLQDGSGFLQHLEAVKKTLASARPTARNLFWALDRMEQCAVSLKERPAGEILEALYREAEAIRQEDFLVCKAIGEAGLTLLKPGMGILTHCNAGALATCGYGTATAPIYLGQERGYGFRVFADETRPLLQGARLTAFELQQAGVDVTLICDNMAASVMAKGWVDAVLVGCDCVAANGDVVNKIGTSMVALAAKHYGIPFYVCAPFSTIDKSKATGKEIPIEQREGREITRLWYEAPMAPGQIKTYNPAFDVTDHALITAYITEKGILTSI